LSAAKHIAFRDDNLHRRGNAMSERVISAPDPPRLVTATTEVLSQSESNTRQRKHRVLGLVVELAIAALGAALMVIGVGANRSWLDHHLLPSFLLPRDWFVATETAVRVVLAIVGAWLVAHVRPAAGRVARTAPGPALAIGAAIVLAVVASEPVLRRIEFRPVGWLTPDDEPRRQADVQLGWTLVPSRVGHTMVGGRDVEYVVDANGYRVGRLDQPVDRTRPTIVFTGESVMFGEGLTWPESIPAQVAALTRVQSANLAVHGFGNDQAFLRLQQDLPRFDRPVAVVSLFMPALFGRNLDRQRPHLGVDLVWQPAAQQWRVQALLGLMVPYRRQSTIDAGVELTRRIFTATAALAHARGATPLVIVPQFGVESAPEMELRQRIVSDLDVPVAVIPLDPAWRLPWDRHPDARAAHAIAVAIAARISR